MPSSGWRGDRKQAPPRRGAHGASRRMQQRREAAEKVAAQLFHAENTINAAMSAAAELVALMPQAYVRAGLTAAYGQAAVAEAVRAITALSEARERIGASHVKLSAIQRHIGLGAIAFGEGAEKPPEDDRAARSLRVVEDGQAA
jgi:hypothetical protein